MTRDEASTLFQYQHLPEAIQAVSKPFHDLAMSLFDEIPDEKGAYRTKSVNELWNAKNWAVAGVIQ